MPQKYYIQPFGWDGDREAIPQLTPPDGSVSYEDGFGVNYQEDPDTDPNALDIPRLKFNQMIYDITLNIQQYQQNGFPLFIEPADNGGVAYEYAINTHVRYTGGWAGAGPMVYYSLVDANTANPTDQTKWGLVEYSRPITPGTIELWGFSTIKPGGYVWLNGTTIGNAASNATQRANADTETIYLRIWADYTNVVCPIFNSNGTPGTRGVSAAADYAANKALSMPNWAGNGLFFSDNMGGITPRGRITNGGSGISGTTLGAQGGLETVQLTSNQNGPHAHTGTTDSAGVHNHKMLSDITATLSLANKPTPTDYVAWASLGTPGNTSNASLMGTTSPNPTLGITGLDGAHVHTFTTSSSGLGSAHQNMPPAVIGGGAIMKL